MARIGIPRAFMYFSLGTLWQSFFEALGHEVIVSPPTTKSILDAGVRRCNGHCCLPLKTGFGHAAYLVGKADLLFLPRIVSIERGCYICPKFMGLPDMLRAAIPDLPQFVGGDAQGYRGGDADFATLSSAARVLGSRGSQVRGAYAKAREDQGRSPIWMRGLPPHGSPPAAREAVGLLGHPYNTYDSFASMNLLGRLASMGLSGVTYEMLGEPCVNQGLAGLPRHMFWTFGRRMVGAARFMADTRAVSGIIHVASFGCGPDSFTGQMMSDYCQTHGMPFLELTLDEHTGEAGIETRVEAFADMLTMRAMA